MTQFLIQHWEVLSLGLTVAGFAFASTLPAKAPSCTQDWWDWFRAFVQEIVSMRSTKLTASAEPQVRTTIPASSVPEAAPQAATFQPTK